jgi:hypothetical protein
MIMKFASLVIDLGAPSRPRTGPDDSDRRGDIVVARECRALERLLLLGQQSAAVGTASPRAVRPQSLRPRPLHHGLAPHVGGHPVISNSYEVAYGG